MTVYSCELLQFNKGTGFGIETTDFSHCDITQIRPKLACANRKKLYTGLLYNNWNWNQQMQSSMFMMGPI